MPDTRSHSSLNNSYASIKNEKIKKNLKPSKKKEIPEITKLKSKSKEKKTTNMLKLPKQS